MWLSSDVSVKSCKLQIKKDFPALKTPYWYGKKLVQMIKTQCSQICAIQFSKTWYYFFICIEYPIIYAILRGRVVVFNATFNNISVISWWSVLLVEKTGIPRENYLHVHVSVASHSQTLSYKVVSSTPCHERDLNSQL